MENNDDEIKKKEKVGKNKLRTEEGILEEIVSEYL